jgi:hypothetical protein
MGPNYSDKDLQAFGRIVREAYRFYKLGGAAELRRLATEARNRRPGATGPKGPRTNDDFVIWLALFRMQRGTPISWQRAIDWAAETLWRNRPQPASSPCQNARRIKDRIKRDGRTFEQIAAEIEIEQPVQVTADEVRTNFGNRYGLEEYGKKMLDQHGRARTRRRQR